jgi:hypothetical protein
MAGICITLYTGRQRGALAEIEKHIGNAFSWQGSPQVSTDGSNTNCLSTSVSLAKVASVLAVVALMWWSVSSVRKCVSDVSAIA